MSALCLFNVYNMAKHKNIFQVQGAVVLTTLKNLTCTPDRVQSGKSGKKSNKYPQSSEMATPVLPGWPPCSALVQQPNIERVPKSGVSQSTRYKVLPHEECHLLLVLALAEPLRSPGRVKSAPLPQALLFSQ